MRSLALTVSVIFSCGILCAQHCISGRYGDQVVFEVDEVQVTDSIEYAEVVNSYSGQTQTLMLDVWAPASDIDDLDDRPLVVLIHGGAFQAGNRQEMNALCLGFAQRGYVAATITYRLGWGCDPNAGIFTCGVCGPQSNQMRIAAYNAVQDAHAAVRFLYANASVYGIDREAIFIGGASAGAITAVSTAFLSQSDADDFAPDAFDVSGGLFDSGNDLPQEHSFKGVINHCGAIPDVDALDPAIPVISFHDDLDCVVPFGNGRVLSCFDCNAFPVVAGSQSIHNALAAAGGCTELNVKQVSALHCSWPNGNLISRASCFMKRTLCGVCTSSGNNDPTLSFPCSSLGVDESPCDTCVGDLNSDGLVNISDLLLMLSAFGNACIE